MKTYNANDIEVTVDGKKLEAIESVEWEEIPITPPIETVEITSREQAVRLLGSIGAAHWDRRVYPSRVTELHITLHGNPLSTQHIYGQRGKIRYMKADAKKRKAEYISEARAQYDGPTLEGELSVAVCLFFGDRRRRDWDNYHKLTMDALEGIAWADDSQIKRALVTVHYDKADPRTEIIVRPLA